MHIINNNDNIYYFINRNHILSCKFHADVIKCALQEIITYKYMYVMRTKGLRFSSDFWKNTNFFLASIGHFRVALNVITKARLGAKFLL